MAATVEYVPVGANPTHLRGGDVLLTMRNKLPNKAIRAGQFLKYALDGFKSKLRGHGSCHERHMVDLTHAVTATGHSGGLVEAGWTGTRRTHISDYKDAAYYVVHIDDNAHDRQQMVDHVLWLAEQNNQYGWLTLVSVGLSLASFFKLHLSWGNSKICSGVVAEGLFKGDHSFPVPPAYMRPGNGAGGLAAYFGVPNLHRPDLPNYEGE